MAVEVADPSPLPPRITRTCDHSLVGLGAAEETEGVDGAAKVVRPTSKPSARSKVSSVGKGGAKKPKTTRSTKVNYSHEKMDEIY